MDQDVLYLGFRLVDQASNILDGSAAIQKNKDDTLAALHTLNSSGGRDHRTGFKDSIAPGEDILF
jgi:hypothetical protein